MGPMQKRSMRHLRRQRIILNDFTCKKSGNTIEALERPGFETVDGICSSGGWIGKSTLSDARDLSTTAGVRPLVNP